MEPESRFYYSQRLKLHYVVWGDEANPPLLLIHGGRDHARTWDRVALALRDDYAVYAVDLRGHGDSQWAVGSQYSLPEFVLDVAVLGEAIDRYPLTLIGHSLGGAIALQYAGLLPQHVAKVVAIEGLGPRIMEKRPAHLRMRDWIAAMHDHERRQPRGYRTIEDAIARMQQANPHLTTEMARHLTIHGTRQNDDGTLAWKFDNYVRIHSPYEFNIDDARTIWNQITCPVLLIRGEESMASNPEEDNKASAFHNHRSVAIPNAGHWVHHDQLEPFLAVVRDFLAEPTT
ncbi:MAG: alpha/beta hydrolase [Chloroflexota bacterium]|nr:alpha/beta hydrolase [Chloroflexota bacterium]